MKLELTQKLQQQQILAPQMILSMDILLLTAADLQQRIEKEFMENPALEFTEPTVEPSTTPAEPTAGSAAEQELFSNLSSLQDASNRYEGSSFRHRQEASDRKLESLQNTEGKKPGLKEHLTQQLRLRSLAEDTRELAELLINNLDHRGYFVSSVDELYAGLESTHQREKFEDALTAVRSLDPAGVGAENLQECLLLQLERDCQTYPLETEIISRHLEDLGQNRLPKIAKDLNSTMEDVKDALEIIMALDPLPGARYEDGKTIYIRPDVVVEETDGELDVRVEDDHLPRMAISESCRKVLETSRGNREINSFVRKKIETAQWLIQAVQQRRRTLYDIAVALVDHQREFMLKGPTHLKALKMQTLADNVKVHISTVSRAIKGKYIQTPWGLFDIRYFFTGGVDNADGEVQSRRNIYRKIAQIVEKENKRKPHSDTAIAKILQEQEGLKIARRTVTKYREAQAIPSSRLRKEY